MQQEIDKFIKIRENLAQKLEPAILDVKKNEWDFYTNSTNENMKKTQDAYSIVDNIFKDEGFYKKFEQIDKTKLPKHEAKQLKDIIKNFEDELKTGEEKKALRDKENLIAQKYNSYVPLLKGKEVSRLELTRIFQEEKDTNIRKAAYEAKIIGGDLIADDLTGFVKQRNEYAKIKGYQTYFDYMLKETYDVEPDFLDKVIDDVYLKSKNKIKNILEKRERQLKDFYNIEKLENYHYGLLLDTDPEKEVNKCIKEISVEELTKKVYSGMGYDIDSMINAGILTLDLYPRKNKNTHGFCFDIEAGCDTRILANLRNDITSLDTLCHEMGHSVYNLGISTSLSFFDKDAASSALTEAIAMMMGDLKKQENILSNVVPDNLLQKFKATFKEDEAYFIARSLEIIEFERDLYKHPDSNAACLWQEKRDKYLNRCVEPDNEWATIPHFLSHPAYYQNYFRAVLMKAQIYSHLRKNLGELSKNSDSAEFLKKHIFSYGASVEDYEIIKQLTQKEFSCDDFVETLD